ncbi:uncharacterized protein K02A2.6-like [Haliotis rubra]|uniref:uncharacterized protein K02A2.6-like n=1 Tax=Haliotis rubra TaxID=36100 RepID=UPI001EE4F782|nr:uncharacterized protein K02A2.6-like [Haliotis rubra]
MRFNPVAEHVAGKNMVVADMLSRAPLNYKENSSAAEIHNLVEEEEAYTESVMETKPMSDHKLTEIQEATTQDKTLQLIMSLTRNGWPAAYRDVPIPARAYYPVRGELSVIRNILLYRDRIGIPEVMRTDILDRIHEGHQGLTKCRECAGLSVWWPELNQHIQDKVSSCTFCQINQSAQRKEPLQPSSLPDPPWQRVAADLCTIKGLQYLVVIDCFSRYLEVVYLMDTTSKGVIGKLKCIFSRWGIPEELVTDKGPQFVAHVFVQFKNQYGFKHTTSSPHFPQANGMVEVKIAKHALKQIDPSLLC